MSNGIQFTQKGKQRLYAHQNNVDLDDKKAISRGDYLNTTAMSANELDDVLKHQLIDLEDKKDDIDGAAIVNTKKEIPREKELASDNVDILKQSILARNALEHRFDQFNHRYDHPLHAEGMLRQFIR